MKKHFIVKKNPHSKRLGFIGKNVPTEFVPLPGMGAAHDCLEHSPGDDGSIDNECMALGCSLWTRGMGGYDYKNSSPEAGTAEDFYTHLWGLFIKKECGLKPAKSKLKITPLVYATASLIKEGIIREYYKGSLTIKETILDEFVDTCTYWLQVGFTKGQKRYPDCHTVGALFIKIENLVNNTLKDASEGQEFIISYCVSKGIASIKEV
jgi:hypothetical protein